jgi:ribosomal protein S18 acetylase RimI-like enzyme
VEIRTTTAADYDTIVSVMDQWWGRTVAQILPRLFLDHFHRTSFIAEDAQGLAGFLIGLLSPDQPDTAYVHAIAVAPHCRRDGLAATLHTHFTDLAKAHGRQVITAITSPTNTQSIAFHTSLGFTVTDPIPNYDGPGLDRVLFQRRL